MQGMIPDQMKEKEHDDQKLTPPESPVNKEVNQSEKLAESDENNIAGNMIENNEIVESKDDENLSPCLPKSLCYKLDTTDFRRLYFLVDLWHIQKTVQPVGLHNIIPVLETFKHKTHFSPDVLHSHNKVSYLTMLYPASITCLILSCFLYPVL